MPFSSHPLPAPRDFIASYPASQSQQRFISQARQKIIDILERRSNQYLLVMGPCSIHDRDSALEYASKLLQLSSEVEDVFFPVMRTYVEKPRTAIGWKGWLYDPFLDGTCDIHSGLILARKLFLTLADQELPIAMEFLDPLTSSYLGDLVSWGCIGARTSASQTHRQMASGMPMPIGFKNSIDGNIDVAINGVKAASTPHTFIGMDAMGKAAVISTSGNSHSHIVLRGGEEGENYYPETIAHTLNLLDRANLRKGLMVDCSHDNSQKIHTEQKKVFQSVVEQINDGNDGIIGLSLESHLQSGAQPHNESLANLKYGVSLTDSCLDWDSTAELICWGAERLRSTRKKSSSAPAINLEATCYAE